MSLPMLAPNRSLGDYLWEQAVECQKVAERWEEKGRGDLVSGIRLLSEMLLEAEAAIAECRLGLFLDGRWSYQSDTGIVP